MDQGCDSGNVTHLGNNVADSVPLRQKQRSQQARALEGDMIDGEGLRQVRTFNCGAVPRKEIPGKGCREPAFVARLRLMLPV